MSDVSDMLRDKLAKSGLEEPVARLLSYHIDEQEEVDRQRYEEAEGYFEDVRRIVGNPSVAQILMTTQTALAIQEMEDALYGDEDSKSDAANHRTIVGRLFGRRPAAKPTDEPAT